MEDIIMPLYIDSYTLNSQWNLLSARLHVLFHLTTHSYSIKACLSTKQISYLVTY